ncbi:MAG: TonB-dependent receptor [Desulfobacterales bacterium]|nr:TonB-dependent receptor [Desulfobacterales bacterium]
MKRKWMTVFLLMMLISPLAATAQTHRDDEGPPASLPEVVVTGTRTAQEIQKIPSNISVITAADIQRSSAKTAVDLLRREEGVVVRDLLGNGKAAQVDLRGFGETASSNTLVLVDGRRTNEIDLSGVDWAQIPVEQIERIEVLRGPGSVLYGDNATAGVINIITKSPSGKLTAGGGVTLGSYDRYRVDAQAGGGYGRTAVSFYGSHEDSDGYRDNNDYRADDFGGKAVWDATDRIRLNLSGSYHEDSFGLPGALTQSEVNADRRQTVNPDDQGSTRDYFVKAGLDWDLRTLGQLLADLSYRDRSGDSKFPDAFFPFKNDFDTETLGFTPRYVLQGNVFDRTNKLIAGVDLYHTQQDNTSYSGFFSPLPSSPTGLSDVDRDSVGAYLNNEFYVLDNLLLTLGARREYVKYDFDVQDLSAFPLAPLNESKSDSENAYHAGLTFLYGLNSSVFTRVSRSFRFPLVDELVVYDFDTGQIRVNPDLKPQTGTHYELGVRHYFTPKLRANLTLFRAEIEDEIFFNRPVFTNENYPKTLHQGIEAGARAEVLKHVAVTGNYTYEKATFERGPYRNETIPAVPYHRANVGLRIFDLLPGVELAVDVSYYGSSFAVSDFENDFEKLDDYFTLDLKLSYEWEMFRAFVGVNNLTNEEYSEYAVIGGTPLQTNFYPAPERNFVFGLRAAF